MKHLRWHQGLEAYARSVRRRLPTHVTIMNRICALLLAVLIPACSRSEGTDDSARSRSAAIPTPTPQADTVATQAPPLGAGRALDSLDFIVAGVSAGMDSATALARLGEPDSIRVDPNPLEPGTDLLSWYYRDLSLGVRYGVVGGITLDTPGLATARGLRVGDTLERMRSLYGEPSGTSERSWYYLDPIDHRGLHAIDMRIANGTVISIFLGYWLD